MKFLGYRRMKGEKEGKSWNFVQLYIERAKLDEKEDMGGTQLVTTYSQKRGLGFPTVTADEFTKLIREGLRIGCEVQCYRDFDNNTVVEVIKDNPFEDIKV